MSYAKVAIENEIEKDAKNQVLQVGENIADGVLSTIIPGYSVLKPLVEKAVGIYDETKPKPQENSLSDIIKIIDKPLKQKRKYSAPFLGIFPPEKLQRISTGWYEIMEVRSIMFYEYKMYQFFKNQNKVAQWRQNITTSFDVILKIKTLSLLLTATQKLLEKFKNILKEATDYLNQEFKTQGEIDQIVILYTNIQQLCSKFTDEIVPTGDEQDQTFQEQKIWIQILSSVSETKLSSHIPFLQQNLNDYMGSYASLQPNLTPEKYDKFQVFDKECIEWNKNASDLVKAVGEMLQIIDFPKEVNDKVTDSLYKGIALYDKIKGNCLETYHLRNQLTLLRTLLPLHDEYTQIQMAALPYINNIDVLNKINKENLDLLEKLLKNYRDVLIQQKGDMSGDNNSVLASIIATLNALPAEFTSKDVKYNDYNDDYQGVFYEKLEGLDVTNRPKMAAILASDTITQNYQPPPDMSVLIKKAKYEDLKSESSQQIEIEGYSKLQLAEKQYNDINSKYQASQNIIKYLNSSNLRIQCLRGVIKNVTLYTKFFDDKNATIERAFQDETSSWIDFYKKRQELNLSTIVYDFETFDKFIKNYLKSKDCCTSCKRCFCFCFYCCSDKKNSFDICYMTKEDVRKKIAKIIRKRCGNKDNSMFTSTNERLKTLVFADIIEFLNSKKVWGALKHATCHMKVDAWKNFDTQKNGPADDLHKKINVDFKLNPVLKKILLELAEKL